jgi:antitoxin (DNA-binding transcriptional repressor) of toxin-antitoxin stability system
MGIANRTPDSFFDRGSYFAFDRFLAHVEALVAAGADIVITSRGEPVVRLSPVGRGGARQFGIDRGRFVVPDDFDGPPDEEVLQG